MCLCGVQDVSSEEELVLTTGPPISECEKNVFLVKIIIHFPPWRLELIFFFSGKYMVLILDGDSDIGAQVRCILSYLICLRHLIKSSHKSFFFRKDQFSVMHAQLVLSYHHKYLGLNMGLHKKLYKYIMVQRHKCAGKEQKRSLLFDLFNAFD